MHDSEIADRIAVGMGLAPGEALPDVSFRQFLRERDGERPRHQVLFALLGSIQKALGWSVGASVEDLTERLTSPAELLAYAIQHDPEDRPRRKPHDTLHLTGPEREQLLGDQKEAIKERDETLAAARELVSEEDDA